MPPRIPPPASLPAFNMSQTVHSAVSTPLLRSARGTPLPGDHSRRAASPHRRSSARNSLTEESDLRAHAKAVGLALGQKGKSPYGLEIIQAPAQFGAMDNSNEEEAREGMVPRPHWSIITDGIHCHPQAVNFAYKAHPEGCVLVTDGGSVSVEWPWING